MKFALPVYQMFLYPGLTDLKNNQLFFSTERDSASQSFVFAVPVITKQHQQGQYWRPVIIEMSTSIYYFPALVKGKTVLLKGRFRFPFFIFTY